MVDVASIGSAISSIKTAFDIANSMIQLKSATDIQAKVIELNAAILSAQGSAMAAQADQAALLAKITQLETKIISMEKWSTEQQRYELVAFPTGTFAYSLRTEAAKGEPPHLICPTCYNDGYKSLLQTSARIRGGERVKCQRCETVLELKESGPIQVIRDNSSWMA